MTFRKVFGLGVGRQGKREADVKSGSDLAWWYQWQKSETVRKEPARRQRWQVFWSSLSLKWQRKNQVDVFRRKANIVSKYRLESVPWPLEIHLKRNMLPFSFVYLLVKFHSLCSLGEEMKVRNETCSFTSNPAREQPSKCRCWRLLWRSRGWESAFQCRGPGFDPWLGN